MSRNIKVAINGFGRIGRAFYRLASQNDELNIVAINDLGDEENLKYLLKYDSAQGIFDGTDSLGSVKMLHEKDPTILPWKELGIDIVVESTGVFRKKEQARAHIYAGAKRVVISAPSDDAQTVLMGENLEDLNVTDVS